MTKCLIKNFFKLFFYLLCLCFISIKSITQNIKIKKLPYLTINKNNSDLPLKKLSLPSHVYGSAFGLNYYYVNLYLGNEMKKQTYILDTGSNITTSPCQPYCTNCGKHLNSYHNVIDKSKIISCSDEKCGLVKSFCGKNNICSFNSSYSENSTLQGIYINELIRFGEDYNLKNGSFAPIGCTTSEDNLFFTQKADGIMGLANNENNFIFVLNKVGAIDNNIFGLCLAQKGGYLSIGDINTTFHKEEITYLNLQQNYFFFSLNMKNILIEDNKIKKYQPNKYSLIIDSGTTLTYFPEEIFNEIIENIISICNSYDNKKGCGEYEYNKDFGPCFSFESIEKMEDALYQYWPNFTFFLETYGYKWTPDEYLFNITNRMKIMGCMGFNAHNENIIKMGSTWMIGHEIIFDINNNKIGIAEAYCDKNNKEMNFIGIEKDYNEETFEFNNIEYISLFNYLNKEKFSYIINFIIIFLFIVCLAIVFIKFKRWKQNILFFFMKKENINKDNMIPIKYDINDSLLKNEKRNNDLSTVFLINKY